MLDFHLYCLDRLFLCFVWLYYTADLTPDSVIMLVFLSSASTLLQSALSPVMAM